jgi:integrase
LGTRLQKPNPGKCHPQRLEVIFYYPFPADKSASYRNSILNAGLIPLGWAYEERLIPADIAKDFERYGGKATKRGVLTVEEAGTLFAKPWADAAMAASLFSATTGMRQGEVLAVRGEDIGEAVLNVVHSWSAADGLKSPKNGESRRVPLLPEVREAFLAQLTTNPYTDIPESERTGPSMVEDVVCTINEERYSLLKDGTDAPNRGCPDHKCLVFGETVSNPITLEHHQ